MSASPAYNRNDVDVEAQRKAVETINNLIEAAEANFEAMRKQVEEIADRYDIEVYLNIAGHGSTYVPQMPKDWDGSSCSGDDYRERGEWNSSSYSC